MFFQTCINFFLLWIQTDNIHIAHTMNKGYQTFIFECANLQLQCYIEDLSCSTTGTLTLVSWRTSRCVTLSGYSPSLIDGSELSFINLTPYLLWCALATSRLWLTAETCLRWQVLTSLCLSLTPSSPNAVTAFKDIPLPLKFVVIERCFAVAVFILICDWCDK